MNAPAPIPAGVLALVGEAVRQQREAEQRCVDVLTEHGYQLVHLPILEYAHDHDATGYRFVDRSGRLLALRTDFTPAAARVLAPALESGPWPLSICYAGEVIRPQPARLRQLPELYQLGFERYGVSNEGLDALELALELLRTLGVESAACHLTVSVAGLTEKILAQVLQEPADEELVELLRVRDLDALADAAELGAASRQVLAAAALGETPASWQDALGVRSELESIQPYLEVAANASLAATIDVAPRLAGAYYHGAVFALWGRRTRAVLAAGGEYEVATQSRALPAVGACLSLGVALEEATC